MNETAPQRLHVIRHADAGNRASWPGDDERRPLSPRGAAQAGRIAGLLGTLPVRTVLSSPSLRCVETVAPLAACRRVPVDEVRWLAEGSDGATAADRLLAACVAHGSDGDLAACSHGDVVAAVLETLVARGARYAGKAAYPKAVVLTVWLEAQRPARIVRDTSSR